MARRTLDVTGVSCSGCEEAVEDALGALDGVSRVDAGREDASVAAVADDDVSEGELRAAVRDAGYEVADGA